MVMGIPEIIKKHKSIMTGAIVAEIVAPTMTSPIFAAGLKFVPSTSRLSGVLEVNWLIISLAIL